MTLTLWFAYFRFVARSSIPSFLEKKGRGGMFSTRWFDKSVISDTRKTMRNTVEGLRWDRVQQERASTADSTSNAAGASGKTKTASTRRA